MNSEDVFHSTCAYCGSAGGFKLGEREQITEKWQAVTVACLACSLEDTLVIEAGRMHHLFKQILRRRISIDELQKKPPQNNVLKLWRAP